MTLATSKAQVVKTQANKVQQEWVVAWTVFQDVLLNGWPLLDIVLLRSKDNRNGNKSYWVLLARMTRGIQVFYYGGGWFVEGRWSSQHVRGQPPQKKTWIDDPCHFKGSGALDRGKQGATGMSSCRECVPRCLAEWMAPLGHSAVL